MGPRLRIIGIGNLHRGDDAVGLVAAERLAVRVPPGVTVQEHAGDGVSLLQLWEPDDRVILIDAVVSGAPPGTIYRRDLLVSALPAGIAASTTHAFGVREAVELARALGRLPASLLFIGIEGQDFSPGHGFSLAVAAALDAVVDGVATEARGSGGHGSS